MKRTGSTHPFISPISDGQIEYLTETCSILLIQLPEVANFHLFYWPSKQRFGDFSLSDMKWHHLTERRTENTCLARGRQFRLYFWSDWRYYRPDDDSASGHMTLLPVRWPYSRSYKITSGFTFRLMTSHFRSDDINSGFAAGPMTSPLFCRSAK